MSALWPIRQERLWGLPQTPLHSFLGNHMEEPQCLFNGSLLFFRASRLFAVFGLRFVVVLPFDDAVLLLYSSDIQIRYVKSILLLDPFLNLLVGGSVLEPGHIHFFQIELDPDVLYRDRALGNLNNRLGFFLSSKNFVTRSKSIGSLW